MDRSLVQYLQNNTHDALFSLNNDPSEGRALVPAMWLARFAGGNAQNGQDTLNSVFNSVTHPWIKRGSRNLTDE